MNTRLLAVAASAAVASFVLAQQPRPSFVLPVTTADVAAPLADPRADTATAAERARRAAERLQQLDAAAFDLEARIAALGADAAAAFGLLRDEIGFQSYAGVMRGPALTYADRAGNALDRAMLLAELLRRQGFTVRFVRGRLPDVRADELVAAIFAPPRAVPLATFGQPGLAARVAARAARDYAAVRTVLGGQLPTPASSNREDLREEVRDHVWVQVQKDGAWVDFDPAFAGFEPGRSACSVEETWGELPTTLQQQIEVRLVVERLAGDRLAATTALRHVAPAWQWLDQQVFVLHSPVTGLGSGIAAALGTDVACAWTPVLAVGEELMTGSPVDCGKVRRAGALDAFTGESSERSDGRPQDGDDALAAEWLEIEITCPDGRRELHRRALLDRVPPAVRARGTLATADLLPMPVSPEGPLFCRQVHTLAFAAGRHDMHGLADGVAYLTRCFADAEQEPAAAAAPSTADVGSDELFANLWPLALQTFHAQWFVDQEVVPALHDVPGVRFYVEAPRLWITSLVPQEDGTWSLLLDLRRDKLRGLADSADKATSVAERKLWFALIGGAVEHEFLAQAIVEAGLPATAVSTTSAQLRPGQVQVVRGAGRGSGCATADVANGVRRAAPNHWIVASLARGCLVVLPADNAGKNAFWEIDPNGDARAVYGDDWNGSLASDLATGEGSGFPNSYTKGPRTSPVGRGGLGGSGGGGVYEVNPDGTSRPVKPGAGGGGNGPRNPGGPRGGPRRPQAPKGKGGGGSEYATILESVSLPGAVGFVGLCAAVAAAIAKALGAF